MVFVDKICQQNANSGFIDKTRKNLFCRYNSLKNRLFVDKLKKMSINTRFSEKKILSTNFPVIDKKFSALLFFRDISIFIDKNHEKYSKTLVFLFLSIHDWIIDKFCWKSTFFRQKCWNTAIDKMSNFLNFLSTISRIPGKKRFYRQIFKLSIKKFRCFRFFREISTFIDKNHEKRFKILICCVFVDIGMNYR